MIRQWRLQTADRRRVHTALGVFFDVGDEMMSRTCLSVLCETRGRWGECLRLERKSRREAETRTALQLSRVSSLSTTIHPYEQQIHPYEQQQQLANGHGPPALSHPQLISVISTKHWDWYRNSSLHLATQQEQWPL